MMHNFVCWIVSLLLLSTSLSTYAGQPSPVAEQKAKIIKYLITSVKWPCCTDPNSEFNVCLLGNPSNTQQIKSLSGTTIKNYKVNVKTLSTVKDENLNCQIIYLAASEKPKAEALKKQFKGKPTILLADFDHFAMNGGSMNFTLIKHTVALTVNIETLKESQIQFNLKEYNRITVVPRDEDLDKP